MADIQDSFKLIFNKIENYQKYQEFKEKKVEQINKKGESFEKRKSDITKPLGEWDKKKQKWLDEKKTLFDDLLDTYNLSKRQDGDDREGNNKISDNDPYLKKVFVKSVREVEPQIKTILSECVVKALGCTIDQEIQQNQTFYIKTQSVDLFNIFEVAPEDKLGPLYYEKKDIKKFDKNNLDIILDDKNASKEPEREMYDIEKEKIDEWKSEIKKQDEILLDVGKDIKKLKINVKEISKSIDLNEKMIKKTQNKADGTESELKRSNKQLKDILEKVGIRIKK